MSYYSAYRRIIHLFTLAVCLMALTGGMRASAADTSSCEVCHPTQAVAHRQSVHAGAELSCVTCHGGDARDPDASAMAASKGFRGSPSRLEIPRMCASCHADRSVMSSYGLSTHQMDDYLESAHGKGWRKGDARVAVCTDCHSAHLALPEKDRRSTVSHANVAKTCDQCHGDKALMGQYNLKTTAYQEYHRSVHAQMIDNGTNKAAPTCTTCHASHGALPVEVKRVSYVCSQCHSTDKHLLLESPHAALIRSGAMTCDSCHGHHEIARISDQQLVSTCAGCHPRGSAASKRGDEVYALISGARKRLGDASATIDALERKGLFVQDLRGRLEEGNMGLVEATRDQHTLNVQHIAKKLVMTDAVVDEVSRASQRFTSQLMVRKLFLIPLWAFVILMVILLFSKRNRKEQA